MSTTISFIILAEVLLTLFVVWGFMHEEKFVQFEDKIIFSILRFIRSKKAATEIARREKINEKAVYTPVRPVAKSAVKHDTAA